MPRPAANFTKRWLAERGLRVAAIYAAPGSDDRDDVIRQLEDGSLDAVCSVDVFNEGVDVPSVDRVVMLRPTESGVIFLQQLGRGLRAAEGKDGVTIVDFVGNHRIFLERLRRLLSLGGSTEASVRPFLEANGPVELPAGCSVDLEVEAKALLERLFKVGGAGEVERAYRELRLERDERPRAGELERLGYRTGTLRARYGSWFGFVKAEGDLSSIEAQVVESAGAFLAELETTAMSKSFKMVTLQVLLDAEALGSGLALRELALRSHALLRRSPELIGDVPVELVAAPANAAQEDAWIRYWRTNPIEAWTAAKKNEKRLWFRVDGERFVPAPELAAVDQTVLAELVRELVDLRLMQYRARKDNAESSGESFVCAVTWNKRNPILKLPGTQTSRKFPPPGERDVRVDGRVWSFKFAAEFCNVARPIGSSRNELPDLLHRWFGPAAGRPGTRFSVRFYSSPDGLWAEPVRNNVVALAPRFGIAAYPDLRAAAGHGTELAVDEGIEQSRALLPLGDATDEIFAVRVTGSSMDGGRTPLREGDWAVFRVARALSREAVRNRVVLVRASVEGGSQVRIKRLVERDGQWLFVSDHPDGPSFPATAETVVLARLEASFAPEELAPPVGTRLSVDEAAPAFGVDALPSGSGRAGGHLFLRVDERGQLAAYDLVRVPGIERRAAETAFVLAGDGDELRYLGVGRWSAEQSAWRIPEVDHATWKRFGEGRGASRTLPDGAVSRAEAIAAALLALPSEERWIERPGGGRARVVRAAAEGGLRIDGGDGGFEERTVSLIDLAWVVVAADAQAAEGGLLDEARVNRARYLEGTPKGATRWIDTGWAIAAWRRMRGR